LFIPCSTTSPLVAILTVMRALWKPQDSYKAKAVIEKGQCTHHLVTQTWTVWLNNVGIVCSYLTVVRKVVWIIQFYLIMVRYVSCHVNIPCMKDPLYLALNFVDMKLTFSVTFPPLRILISFLFRSTFSPKRS
jgi:hypothetical protein